MVPQRGLVSGRRLVSRSSTLIRSLGFNSVFICGKSYPNIQMNRSRGCGHLTPLPFPHEPNHTGAAHTVFLRDIGKGYSCESVSHERSVVNIERRTSEPLSFHSGPSHACSNALD